MSIEYTYEDFTWIQGTWSDIGLPAGTPWSSISPNSARIIQQDLIEIDGAETTISLNSGFQCIVYGFDADEKYLGMDHTSGTSFKDAPYVYNDPDAVYIAVAVRRSSNASITPSQVASTGFTLTISGGVVLP